jgi:type I restriction enzyme M protein
MLTQKHRIRINSLWNRFHRAGMSNPLEAVEQISYLILLRFLDLQDKLGAASAKRARKKHVSAFTRAKEARWSEFIKTEPEVMLATVRDAAFPMLKDTKVVGETIAAATKDAVFAILKPELLAFSVRAIEDLNLGDLKDEYQADVYEEIMSNAPVYGVTGQFGTPRHIIRTMVEAADPRLGESICDPVAGTGGFLISSYQWLLKSYTPPRSVVVGPDGSWHKLTGSLLGNNKRKRAMLEGNLFTGYDGDATMVRIGLVNMLLHGIRDPNLRAQNTLSTGFNPLSQKLDLVFATLPFGSHIKRSDLNREVLKLETNKAELLYIEMCLAMLKRGGRCAVIVPDEVLFGSSAAHKELRQHLISKNRLDAVVCLPSGAFKPFSGIKTVILFITKGGSTKKVWFYEVTADGYTLDDRRILDPKGDNNLRYVPQWFQIQVRKQRERWASKQAREVAERQSWFAGQHQIAKLNFSLAPSAYRPVSDDEHNEKDPVQIIEHVRFLETLIEQKLERIAARCKEVPGA